MEDKNSRRERERVSDAKRKVVVVEEEETKVILRQSSTPAFLFFPCDLQLDIILYLILGGAAFVCVCVHVSV